MSKVIKIGICKNKGDKIVNVNTVKAVQGKGLVNDRKFKEDNNKKSQLTLIEVENINVMLNNSVRFIDLSNRVNISLTL